MKLQTMNVSQIQLSTLLMPSSGELSDLFIRYCEFCLKKCESDSKNYIYCKKLGPDSTFFCEFCLRNAFQTQRKNNVLILSFKSIIAWFYFQNYLNGRPRMWFCQIKDYIQAHKEIGLRNPLFMYDEETMLWFIDFSRIGDDGKKIQLESVCETIESVVDSFDLEKNVPSLDVNKFFSKYANSISEFHKKRERPSNKHSLSPTFLECLPPDIKFPYDKIKNFHPIMMKSLNYS
jgi:hypothetical protein